MNSDDNKNDWAYIHEINTNHDVSIAVKGVPLGYHNSRHRHLLIKRTTDGLLKLTISYQLNVFVGHNNENQLFWRSRRNQADGTVNSIVNF